MPLIHYLLIYDHEQQKLLETLDLGGDGPNAAQKYAEVERSYQDRKGIEIVLVGADSLDTIRRTHVHYFSESVGDPFETLIAG